VDRLGPAKEEGTKAQNVQIARKVVKYRGWNSEWEGEEEMTLYNRDRKKGTRKQKGTKK